MNERSDSKTDITFELRTVENLSKSIKGKMALFTCTVLFPCSRYYSPHCSHIWNDDVTLTDDVTLNDEVSRFYWTKILMYC